MSQFASSWSNNEIGEVLKSADLLLEAVIAEGTKVYSTPPRDWTFFTRRCAMQSLNENAEVQFVSWMSGGVKIREIVKIIDTLKSLKESALHATWGESRVWGRSFIKNDTARLKDLLGGGCKIESASDSNPVLRIRSSKFALMPPERADGFSSQLLTPNDVAAILNVSRNTVIRHFREYPGVIDLSSHCRPAKRGQRAYRTIRIPRYVLERFLHKHRIQ